MRLQLVIGESIASIVLTAENDFEIDTLKRISDHLPELRSDITIQTRSYDPKPAGANIIIVCEPRKPAEQL